MSDPIGRRNFIGGAVASLASACGWKPKAAGAPVAIKGKGLIKAAVAPYRPVPTEWWTDPLIERYLNGYWGPPLKTRCETKEQYAAELAAWKDDMERLEAERCGGDPFATSSISTADMED